MIYRRALYLCLAAALASCAETAEPMPVDQSVLARVGNHQFTLKEAQEEMPDELSGADSIQYLRLLAERWTQSQVMLDYAENRVAHRLDLSRMLKEYRESLLIHEYESEVLRDRLDTQVRPVELFNYYEAHKDHYRLEEPVIRGTLIRIPVESHNNTLMESWWKGRLSQTDSLLWSSYVQDSAQVSLLDTAHWYSRSEWEAHLPASLQKSWTLKDGLRRRTEADGHAFYIDVEETIPAGKNAPLGYVQDDIRKLIVYRRRIELLERVRSEIYEKAISDNRVTIY